MLKHSTMLKHHLLLELYYTQTEQNRKNSPLYFITVPDKVNNKNNRGTSEIQDLCLQINRFL